MAFQEISKQGSSYGGRGNLRAASISASVNANGTVRIALSEDLASALGEPQAVRILLGDGEHAGRIALIPCAKEKRSGFSLFKKKGSRQSFVQAGARLIGVPKAAKSSVDLPYELTATGIIIDVRPLCAATLSIAA